MGDRLSCDLEYEGCDYDQRDADGRQQGDEIRTKKPLGRRIAIGDIDSQYQGSCTVHRSPKRRQNPDREKREIVVFSYLFYNPHYESCDIAREELIEKTGQRRQIYVYEGEQDKKDDEHREKGEEKEVRHLGGKSSDSMLLCLFQKVPKCCA